MSGPSGAGKSSLVNELEKEISDIYFSVSVTTRQKREGEKEGIDYHFVSIKEFEEDIKEGFFLEWAKVHGNYYGTSLKHTLKAIDEGKLVLFDIDVQGFLQAKEKLKDLITSVFITTPSQNELQRRLVKRATDSKEVIEKRVKNALYELEMAKEYDFFIINDDLDRAKKELLSIAIASRIKTSNFDLDNFIKEWKKQQI
jgi:guanylate kinase